MYGVSLVGNSDKSENKNGSVLSSHLKSKATIRVEIPSISNCGQIHPGERVAGITSRSRCHNSNRTGSESSSRIISDVYNSKQPIQCSSGRKTAAALGFFSASTTSDPVDPKSHTLVNRSQGFEASLSSERPSGQAPHNPKLQPPNFRIADLASQFNLNSSSGEPVLIEQPALVGTMQTIEKPYVRLSRTPNPSEVRPPEILQKTLSHVLRRWKEQVNYSWACDLFRGIRQDLVVQQIRSDLTVRVYEANADIALEAGDQLEFSQCQSQLSFLYTMGIPSPRRLEFTAYRILYYINVEDLQELHLLILSLKPSERKDPFIQFALKAFEAWSLRNYRRLIHLACDSKLKQGKSCRRLLSWSLDRERGYALRVIFKSYRPVLSLDYIAKVLGFADTLSCANFITEKLGIDGDLLKGDEKVDCKEVWSQILRSGVNA